MRLFLRTKQYSVLQSTAPGHFQYYKVLFQYYSVLQSTTPYYKALLQYYRVLLLLLRTTKCYSVLQSTSLYYSSTILCTVKFYSVLQSTTPVLLCTTKNYSAPQSTTPALQSTSLYYSSTTLYCKVLPQYYSALQRTTWHHKVLLQHYKILLCTTPILLCTTKCYSVLQSTTPVLLCTTKDYSVLQSTTPVLLHYYSDPKFKVWLQRYSVLQSITRYRKVLLQHYSVPYNRTTKFYSGTSLVLLQYYSALQSTAPVHQRHQLLPLPCKMIRVLDPPHIWNFIYIARSNKCHHPTSRNTAPAMQNYSRAWSWSHMKRHLQGAEQQVSPSNLTKYCACHAKWRACLILLTYETSFTMRGATSVTLQPHQILCLPRKMTCMLDPPHIWNVIYNAQNNKCHPSTSPNTAPAMQNYSHAWSWSRRKHHLQGAEQQVSPSNLTKTAPATQKWPC